MSLFGVAILNTSSFTQIPFLILYSGSGSSINYHLGFNFRLVINSITKVRIMGFF
jgi:hypothetical protein